MRSSLFKRLKRVRHHLPDCDRAGAGFPGNRDGRTLLFDLDPILFCLRKEICPPFIKRKLFHGKKLNSPWC